MGIENGLFDDKVLLVITPSYPNLDESYIAETFVKYQVAELKKFFKKVIIIAPVFNSFGYFKKDKLCMDYSYDNVEVYYPRCIYIPIFWLSKILIDNRLQAVERCIEEHHLCFDIIHAHFTWPSGYIGVMLKKRYDKPVIITIHENGEWFDQEVSMDNPYINAAWSGADALIRVNRKDVPVLQRYNKCVYAIPNGFSQNFMPIDTPYARQILNLPLEKKILFALGNLIERKGFDYLIDAMKLVCDERDDVICLIGGSGPCHKKLQNHIDRLNLNDNIKLIGSVPNAKLPFWMNACDIFVLPSLSESFGIVQIEALACGKPVIATYNGGSEEILVRDDYGTLIEPKSSFELRNAVIAGLEKKWDNALIIEYSRGYRWEKVAEMILTIFIKSVSDFKIRE